MHQFAPILPTPSPLLRWGFVALAAGVAALFVAGVQEAALRAGRTPTDARRHATAAAVAAVIWMTLTAIAAASGALHFEPPPTMAIPLVGTLALALSVSFGPIGGRLANLPITALVGFQAFRILVELLLHRAYIEGLMPVQMSFSGRNFDIVSGITAIIVAAIVARQGSGWNRKLVLAWNVVGLGLLVNIVTIAMLSAPTPFRAFMNDPPNVWITQAPWIWLPAVMVFAALAGHLLVFRRLVSEARRS